jgi:hypothetical protein
MKLDTINNDMLDTVTGGQVSPAVACALGAHEAGRKLESNRGWFSKKPSARELVDSAVNGCAAGLRALASRSGQPA